MDLPAFDIESVARWLNESLIELESVLALVAPVWLVTRPASAGAGGEAAWSVAMNLAHTAVYEELLAAPVLESMAAGRDGADAAPSGDEGWFTDGARRLSEAPIGAIVQRLRGARDRQIAAVRSFSAETLNQPLTPLWGDCWGGLQPAGWVALKTVQHTWDHGNPIFQIALFAPRQQP